MLFAETGEFLEFYSRLRPEVVMPELRTGDLVHYGWSKFEGSAFIEIDNPVHSTGAILKRIPAGEIPAGRIYDMFEPKERKIDEITRRNCRWAGNNAIIPYSSFVKSWSGHCCQKGIAIQLVNQAQARPSYLVNGSLVLDSETEPRKGLENAHMYNIFFSGGMWYLFDVTNPEKVDRSKRMVEPFAVPVIGVDLDAERFLLPESRRLGRNYSWAGGIY